MPEGILNIDKPAGWTSHDVVAKLRGVLGIRKIGHAGTLDPAATGVLVVCVGNGTRIVEYLIEDDKIYEGIMKLGEATDTQDGEGSIVEQKPWDHLTEEGIVCCFAKFTGEIFQTPPSFSAVKLGGVPSYKLARSGRAVAAPERTVTIYSLEFLRKEGAFVTFKVHCSKGTYIRTLCQDIGESLGTAAHLAGLRRVRAGQFDISNSLTLERFVHEAGAGNSDPFFLPVDDALGRYPAVTLDPEREKRVIHGNPVSLKEGDGDLFPAETLLRLRSQNGQLIAMGRLAGDRSGKIKIEKVLIHQDHS